MIEPIRINDNLIYFYWGRHPSHANMDMRLGGGCHVIHHSSEAIVVDTMGMPGQAEWLRSLASAASQSSTPTGIAIT